MNNTFFLTLRALIFNTGYYGSGIIAGIASLFLWPTLPYRYRWPIITLWNRFVLWWLKICCGVSVNIIDQRTHNYAPCIVMSKHQSTWETLFLQYYLAPISVILKKELLRIPFFGWGLAALKPIAIDRGNPMQALKSVKAKGIERLKEGNSILIFPEGTRTPLGKIGNYAGSGADIACSATVAVTPIAHNAAECWPHKQLLKYPGTITLIIGDAIHAEGRHRKEVTLEVKTWIETQIAAMPIARKDGIYSHAHKTKPTDIL